MYGYVCLNLAISSRFAPRDCVLLAPFRFCFSLSVWPGFTLHALRLYINDAFCKYGVVSLLLAIVSCLFGVSACLDLITCRVPALEACEHLL